MVQGETVEPALVAPTGSEALSAVVGYSST